MTHTSVMKSTQNKRAPRIISRRLHLMVTLTVAILILLALQLRQGIGLKYRQPRGEFLSQRWWGRL
jgi:hypothetical protein